MRELKPFNSERIYWAVEQVEREAGDIDDLHLDDNLFYLKSEADNVIAELEMKLAKAKLVLRLNEPEALYSNLDTISRLNHKIDAVERRELHQKYKRCLAMARRCHSESLWWYSKGYGFEKYDKFWEKWEKRWLELAERFK
jgi:hypothetical protein